MVISLKKTDSTMVISPKLAIFEDITKVLSVFFNDVTMVLLKSENLTQ